MTVIPKWVKELRLKKESIIQYYVQALLVVHKIFWTRTSGRIVQYEK